MSEKPSRPPTRHTGRIVGQLCLLAGLSLLLPFRFVRVEGKSMVPTLQDGHLYLLDTFYWKHGGLRRNDIVVLRRGDEMWVKRLVGLPGDEIYLEWAFKDTEEGHRAVVVQLQNFTAHPGGVPARGQWGDRRIVGPDELFVLGDNLNHSTDSTLGPGLMFHVEDVRGVVRHPNFSRVWKYRDRVNTYWYD